MESAGLVLITQEAALRRRMEVVANNVANLSTAGFRRESPLFAVDPVRNATHLPRDANQIAFVADHRIHADLAFGAFTATGNPLDVMVENDGWLLVQSPDGAPAATRNGQLTMNGEGQLVTSAGHLLLDANGAPIRVPQPAQGSLAVLGDGQVMAGDTPVGRLALVRFADPDAAVPRGDGLFSAQDAQPMPQNEVRLRSGGFEGANVEPIRETTRMIEILRSYQAGQKLAEAMDALRRQSLDRLSRAE